MMLCLYFFVATASLIFLPSLEAYNGEYIPKSYYLIDEAGHQSDIFPIRNRRDILQTFLRMRRSDSNSYATASSSAYASAGASATSSSNSNAGGGGGGHTGGTGLRRLHPTGYENNGGYNNQNGGSNGYQETGGYDGPILFSRFGEDTGTGVQVSGQAQGPKAAYASSSSSIDSQGNIKYSVQSGKY